jgi:hypothetical protein
VTRTFHARGMNSDGERGGCARHGANRGAAPTVNHRTAAHATRRSRHDIARDIPPRRPRRWWRSSNRPWRGGVRRASRRPVWRHGRRLRATLPFRCVYGRGASHKTPWILDLENRGNRNDSTSGRERTDVSRNMCLLRRFPAPGGESWTNCTRSMSVSRQ